MTPPPADLPSDIKNDVLYRMLLSGTATPEDQRIAAEWIKWAVSYVPKEVLKARSDGADFDTLRPQPIAGEWEDEAREREELLCQEITALRNDLDAREDVLRFYADPWGKCDQVPDFYSELCFGERAAEALAARPTSGEDTNNG